MVSYPYGRSGYPELYQYHNSRVTKADFQNSAEIGDNEVHFGEDYVYLYEAPAEDDPGRGHYSMWEKADEGYRQVAGMSGDDGMIYDKFQNRSNLRA